MCCKNDYLSIGKISRMTRVNIKSLRYYEKVGVLEPVYTNPVSKYRYYSPDQIHLIEIIQFCIKLDIPLKSLSPFISDKKEVNYEALFPYIEEIAQKRIEFIQNGLDFINHTHQEVISSIEHHHT